MSGARESHAVTAGLASGIVLIILFVILGPGIPEPATTPRPIINLNNNSTAVILPRMIASTPSTVYVVWDDDSEAADEFEIFSRVSPDGGDRFSEKPVRLSRSGDGSGTEPDLTAVGSSVYVVWQEHSPEGHDTDIFLARSTNAGIAYYSPLNLHSTSETQASSPRVASQGSHVFVTWSEVDQERGFSSAYFSRSTDGGRSFEEPLMLNDAESSTNFVLVAASGTNVFVVWDESATGYSSDIFMTRSSDSGVSFSKPVNVSISLDRSTGEKLVVDENNIYLIWYEENGGIFFAYSGDYGESFDVRRLNPGGVQALDPQIAVSGDRVYATWSELEYPHDLVLGISNKMGYVNYTVIGPHSFGTHDVVSDSSGAYVVWDDTFDGRALKLVKVSEPDSIKSQPLTITSSVSEPVELSLAISDDAVYLLWRDVGKVFFKKVSKEEFQ